jgi:hypothetical protein
MNNIIVPKKGGAWALKLTSWLRTEEKTFGLRSQFQLIPDAEALLDPKRCLRELIRRSYRKDYLSAIHNELIAKHIDVCQLERSDSFAPHPIFVNEIRQSLR